jgi:hypothetical protein
MATASAGRADKGSSRGSRAFRAPLHCARLAVGGQGRGEEEPKARRPSFCAQTQGGTMSDPEIEEPARQGALRRRAGAHAPAMDARPEGEHQAQPEVSSRKGRDPDRQPWRQRLVGSDQRR